MKTKSFLFSVLFLAAILVGCERPQQQTEGEANSYITVSVKSSMLSRAATDGDYIDGVGVENEIKSIDFYFFSTSGEPFKFNAPITTGSTSGYSNLYTVTEKTIETTEKDHVEEIVKVTLALQHNMGDYPGSIVAIVNGTRRFENLSFKDFRDHTFNGYATSNGFLMSNSVYVDNDGNEVFQTKVAPENFAVTAEAAKKKPIEIYVERTAVRVEVAQNDKAVTSYDTGYEFVNGTTTKVYAKIKGWDIVTVPIHAYTVKRINKDWEDEINDFTWNHPDEFRSWWADAQFNAENINKQFAYNLLKNPVGIGNYDYCLENTTLPIYAEVSGVHDQVKSRTNVTKAVIAAELVDKDGNKLEIASWYGKDYTIEGLKTAIANSLADKMLYGADGGWKPIEPNQIELVQGSGKDNEEKSYEVYCKLTDDAQSRYNWASDKGGTNIPNDLEQTYIRQNVEVAKVWNGMSYYIVNIEHLGLQEMDGKTTPPTYLPAYYGTVRNHAYQITFGAVKGLGTPVFDPEAIIPEPVQPDDTESFIEAQINVLSWHLIKQDVTLQ
jgi:hypothetical protein